MLLQIVQFGSAVHSKSVYRLKALILILELDLDDPIPRVLMWFFCLLWAFGQGIDK